MQTVKSARIKRESWDRQRAAGRYNAGLVVLLNYRKRRYVLPIGAGDSDCVDVFREGNYVYVVSVNHGLEYAGLEVFELGDTRDEHSDKHAGDQVGSVFLQADYEVREILGPRGTDLAPATIARRLAEYALV